MAFVIGVVLLIWSMLAAAMFAALSLGSDQARPALFDSLGVNACGFDCWLGLIPGQTNAADTFDILERLNFTSTLDSVLENDHILVISVGVAVPVGRENVPVQVNIVDGVTRFIRVPAARLYFTDLDLSPLRLGDIAAAFGPPTCREAVGPAAAALASVFYLTSDGVIEIQVDAAARGTWWAVVQSFSLRPRAAGTLPVCAAS